MHITPVHEGKKPFQCESCGSRFEKFCRLREHKVTMHEENMNKHEQT